MNIKQIALYSVLTSILFVSEQLLSFIPNVQLTFLLIILYNKVLGIKPTIIIVIIHTLLDNLIMGSFTPLIIIPMMMGYIVTLIILQTLFKNANTPLFLALFGILSGIIYSFMFIIVNVLLLDISLKAYIIADIPHTLILVASNFITILWLYTPLNKILTNIVNKYFVK